MRFGLPDFGRRSPKALPLASTESRPACPGLNRNANYELNYLPSLLMSTLPLR